jgi:hypothetical protein
MKANGFRLIVYRAILLVLLSLYFILVFGQVPDSSNYFQQVNYTITKHQSSLPKLLGFDGISSDKQVKLNWRFETTAGLDGCVLERADKSNDFKPVAYFFMTEDINIPSLKYTDKVPQDATYFYRLKFTAKDGSSDSSKVVMIKVGGDQKNH